MTISESGFAEFQIFPRLNPIISTSYPENPLIL